MPDTKLEPTKQHVFANQPKQIVSEKAHGGVLQDKGAPERGRVASSQPDPLEKGSGARELGTDFLRVNRVDKNRVKLVHRTLHLHPLDDAELAHIARADGLSVSKVGATAIHEWILSKIHKREEDLLYPKLKALLREDREEAENHMLIFQMHTAIAAEQGRILITQVLKRLLFFFRQFTRFMAAVSDEEKRGTTKECEQTPMEIFDNLMDQSRNMARANVFHKTQEMKSMLEEWKAKNRKR